MSDRAQKKDPNVSLLQGVLEAAKSWTTQERTLFRDLFCRPTSDADICRARGWSHEKLNGERQRLLRLCMQGSN